MRVCDICKKSEHDAVALFESEDRRTHVCDDCVVVLVETLLGQARCRHHRMRITRELERTA